jgi:hypothetical protein
MGTEPGGQVHPQGAWAGGAASQLVPAPSYDVAMEPRSSGDPVALVCSTAASPGL